MICHSGSASSCTDRCVNCTLGVKPMISETLLGRTIAHILLSVCQGMQREIGIPLMITLMKSPHESVPFTHNVVRLYIAVLC